MKTWIEKETMLKCPKCGKPLKHVTTKNIKKDGNEGVRIIQQLVCSNDECKNIMR